MSRHSTLFMFALVLVLAVALAAFLGGDPWGPV